jgi:subtilase family serine protease
MTINHQWRRATVLAAVVPALALALSVAAAPAMADTSSPVALPSPNSANLLTEGATTTPLNSTQQVALRVYLTPQPGLSAAATAVSDPSSPAYAHFLTAAQYQQQYAPTAAQSTTVSDWLTAQGMTITATTSHYIAVTATVAQADTAFDTQLSAYTTTSGSSAGVVGGFSVPAVLGGDILTVTGIDQIAVPSTSTGSGGKGTATKAAAGKSTAGASTVASFQCSQYWGQYTGSIPEAFGHTTAPTALCGYTPDQIRQVYGIASSPYTGKGATIAIISTDYHPLMEADANEYFASNGEAGFVPGQFSDVVLPTVAASCAGYDPEPDAEEPIDVESAHIAAADADIVNIATDCLQDGVQVNSSGALLQNWLDGVSAVVDQHLADVVSGSLGLVEPSDASADMTAWDPDLEQGALEGIGFDFSSGDGGDQAYTSTGEPEYDVHEAQFPATDPWATAVGGTSTAIGADGGVIADYPWGDNFTTIDSAATGYTQAPPGTYADGSGGGVSSYYDEPDYQQAVVPTALATDGGTTQASRVIPDISADAGLPWLIGWTGAVTDGTYTEQPVGGGTSASSPLIAGLEADAIQAAEHPLGFINPALYTLSGSAAIRDILPVNPADPPILDGEQTEGAGIDTTRLATLGEDGGLTATPGYDDVTGLGAPTTCFVTALAQH